MSAFKMIWLPAVFAAALPFLPVAASAAHKSPQDKAVVSAHIAFMAGDRAGLARHTKLIGGHTLDSYPAFWSLRLRLENAEPKEVRDFLTRNEGTPLAERLNRDWLLELGRKGQWEIFRESYPALVNPDQEVACYALQERWQRQDVSVTAEIRKFLAAPRPLPAGCALLLDEMALAGEITPRELLDRFRLLVRENLMAEARRIAGRLPLNKAPSAVQIENAAAKPARLLERSDADVNTAVGSELVIVALTRLARTDPNGAVSLWKERFQERFPPEDRQYVWAMFADFGAHQHLPEAVEWFKKAGDAPFSDRQLAWRARIALRQENWQEVRNAIERMSPAERNEPVWIYWLARSMLAQDLRAEGEAMLTLISDGHHYYGRLASEELGLPLQIPQKPSVPTKEELAAAADMAGIKRALALYRLGLRSEAAVEWRWAVRGMNDRALLAAAELAGVNGIWDRAINTADNTVAEHDFTMRYPAPHEQALSKQAKARKLEEPLVFGLVRQESRFIADAKSSAGASGLMQLMPSTARRVAKTMGMKGFRLSRLTNPEVNAALGAYYLRHVLDIFGGNAVLAAAAYNAGPGRARRWVDEKPLEGAIYVETIPFSETRQYVKKVMANTVYYAAVMGGEQRSLKSRLGTVEKAAAMKATEDE